MGRNARWLNHTVVHLCYSPWNRAAKQPDCRCQVSEYVRLADKLRPKRPAALLPREKIVCFMHVFLHFGHYTKSRDSSVFRAQRTRREEDQWRKAIRGVSPALARTAGARFQA